MHTHFRLTLDVMGKLQVWLFSISVCIRWQLWVAYEWTCLITVNIKTHNFTSRGLMQLAVFIGSLISYLRSHSTQHVCNMHIVSYLEDNQIRKNPEALCWFTPHPSKSKKRQGLHFSLLLDKILFNSWKGFCASQCVCPAPDLFNIDFFKPCTI